MLPWVSGITPILSVVGVGWGEHGSGAGAGGESVAVVGLEGVVVAAEVVEGPEHGVVGGGPVGGVVLSEADGGVAALDAAGGGDPLQGGL